MSTQLKTEKRDKVGTRQARKLRSEGRIPASLQAEGKKDHLDLSVDEEEFLTTRRRHEHVYDLQVGGASETALVRELHWDVFGERILHIEFRRVDLKVKTQVEVELDFVGHPKSGIVNHLVSQITISAKPQDIPDNVEVKVEGLEPGAHIVASDLALPAGVELAVEPDLAIAQVSELKVVEEPSVEDAAAAAAAAEGEGAEGEAGEASEDGDSKEGGDAKEGE